MKALAHLVLLLAIPPLTTALIDRHALVRRFNPARNASATTPLQLGNGNFAFNADVTGLQTFVPFNTLSAWGWHNDSLPTAPGQTAPADFLGQEWWTHGRLVPYAQPNAAQPALSQWLIANPHRINLARIGLHFGARNVTEAMLAARRQELDLYSGVLTSAFTLDGAGVRVTTSVHAAQDTLAVEVAGGADIGVFVDFPYASGADKFDAPFVGVWDAVGNHTTTLEEAADGAVITHVLDATTYSTVLSWPGQNLTLSGPQPGTHRYLLQPRGGSGGGNLSFTATFLPSSTPPAPAPRLSARAVRAAAAAWWRAYWQRGAFVDLVGGSANASAAELQRRVVLSQYLLAVNSAGRDPPQESGLANNGWYGKFHLEMPVWHLLHWRLWGRGELLDRAVPGVYERFLASSVQRAAQQGYQGARWGKMSDPSGRSAPGEINSLLIWQQPHALLFAELEYAGAPSTRVLQKWARVVRATADFMASYAFFNASAGVYDLGPPLYPVSENTPPNSTRNPTFELAYWRFGLEVAAAWQQRQGLRVPRAWAAVRAALAPLPATNGTYDLYEGVAGMWRDPATTSDHPALVGVYGLLPAVAGVDVGVVRATAARVWASWNLSDSYGWDFPLLAMNAARLGDRERAVAFLLHADFAFDDAGMPEGGTRVPTPYWPASGGLLSAVAMMAVGWRNEEGSRFPEGWRVRAEGFQRAL